MLNLETYQAALGGRPLDLTYMEYELLKFFATHPGKVFTREQLLSRVWGYEYYGGARTVDVHVRRLRAKLGEEHASLIQTVRSVGYRFGQPRGLVGADPGVGSATATVAAGPRPTRPPRPTAPPAAARLPAWSGGLALGPLVGVVDQQPADERAPDRAAEHDGDGADDDEREDDERRHRTCDAA